MTAAETIPKPRGLYKIREAARLVTWADGRALNKQLSKQQAQDWVDSGADLLRWADIPGGKKRISFRDLISLRLIFRLHSHGVSPEVITEDASRLRRILGVEYPYASKVLWEPSFTVFGKLIPKAGSSKYSEKDWEVIYQRLWRVRSSNSHHGLEFDEDGEACVWHPDIWVRIEPGMVSGRPCVARTRIPTWIIGGMAEAGDTVEEIADCYDLDEERVRNAVEWEKQLASVAV